MTQSNAYDISSYLEKYKSWSEKYRPVFQIECSLDALPDGLDANYVWTEFSYEYGSFLRSGFSTDSTGQSSTSVQSYIVTGKPVQPEDVDETVTTYAGFDCVTCDEDGLYLGDTCPECDGQFETFRTLGIEYPNVATNPNEIQALLKAASTPPKDSSEKNLDANFCSMCGTKRTDKAGNFCPNCGAAI